MERIELEVFGRVGGSGSKNFYKGIVAPASKYQKPWRDSVTWAFLEKYGRHFMPFDGAIQLTVLFYLPRPASHFKKSGELSAEGERHPYPDKRSAPDLTKAVRNTEDALNRLAYVDDKRVVMIIARWLWREQPGATVIVEKMENSV